METKRSSINKGPGSKVEPSIDAKLAAEATQKSISKVSAPPSKSSVEKKEEKKKESQSNMFKKVPSKTYEREGGRDSRLGEPERILDNFIEKFEKRSRSRQLEGF